MAVSTNPSRRRIGADDPYCACTASPGRPRFDASSQRARTEGAVPPATPRLGERRPAREVQAARAPIGKRKRDRRVVEHSEPLQPAPARSPVERLARKSPLTRHPLEREPIRGKHDLEAGGDGRRRSRFAGSRLRPPEAAPVRAPSLPRPAPTATRDHASRAPAGARAAAAAWPSSRCSRACSRCLR